MLKITEIQVQSKCKAPDVSYYAKEILDTELWNNLNASSRVIWGNFKSASSGKTLYRSMVDVNRRSFKCSCSSPKSPCKHALALALLYAKQSEAFKIYENGSEATNIKKWIEQKEAIAKTKAEKAATPSAASLKAKAKRQEQRNARVKEGVTNFKRLIEDVIRSALSSYGKDGTRLRDMIQEQAKRLVDAQGPALAALMNYLYSLWEDEETNQAIVTVSKDLQLPHWQLRVYKILTRCYLTYEYFEYLENLDNLDEATQAIQAEVHTQIGFTQSKEQIQSGTAIHDTWLVLDQDLFKENSCQYPPFAELKLKAPLNYYRDFSSNLAITLPEDFIKQQREHLSELDAKIAEIEKQMRQIKKIRVSDRTEEQEFALLALDGDFERLQTEQIFIERLIDKHEQISSIEQAISA